ATGVDLPRLRQLHGHHAGIAPDDATAAYGRVEYRIGTPHHAHAPLSARFPQTRDHNTATIRRTWNLDETLTSVRSGAPKRLAAGADSANQGGRWPLRNADVVQW